MWCKEDLVSWFKNLESYKRIDVMCTLLNLCLPFELRFLGTCLEELGRRDAQILRGVELRVNNPQEFVTDIGSFQSGQPTDMKIRRMMALYLALMRACNRTCVNELFKTLDGWGDRDFTKFSDGDPLQELLLVYTMATNHPVFSFEQRLKCGDIFSKITDSKPYLKENQQQSPPPASPITTPLSTFHIIQPITNPSNSPPPQPFQSAPALIQQQQPMLNPQPLPNPILMGFPQTTMMIPVPTDPLSQAPISAESLNQMQAPTMVIPPDFSIPPPWLLQSRFSHPLYPTVPIETMAQFPPQASSPHMSQPSSPAHSRTGSPTRQQIQQMMPTATSQSIRNNQNRSMRLNRRPSTDTTPPPLLQQQQQQQQQQTSGGQQQPSHQPSSATTTNFMSNEMLNNQHMVKNFDELNVDDAIIQFHNLRNGYARPTMPLRQPNTKTYAHHMQQIHHQHQQQQQQQQMSQSGFNPNLSPFMQNLNLDMQPQMVATGTQQQKAIDSESGSSIGSVSPPPQQQHGQQQLDTGGMGNNNSGNNGSLRNPLTLSRLNGRNTENYAQHNSNSIGNMVQHHQLTTNTGGASAVIVGTNTNMDFNNGTLPANSNIVFIAPQQLQQQQQQQQQHSILIHNPQFNNNNNNRPVAASTSFRNIPGPANGEMLYPFKIPLTSAAFLSSSSSTSSSSLKSQSINTTNTQQQQQQQQQSQQSSPSEQNPPAPQAVLLQPTPYPMSKYHVQSCFNCGSTNHIGLNCQEVSMEDVTRNATYKLDYTVSTQPHTTTPQLTTAASVSTSTPPQSMTNSSCNDPQLAPTTLLAMSNNNFDDSSTTTESTILESQIPIIDLTQDTSSSSSSTCSSTK